MKKFGLIFHWGLYSVPAFDDPLSASRRRVKNGAEWYYKRLHEKGTYRPISGYKETQEYHEKKYGTRDYYDFASELECKSFDKWMELAVEVGAEYVILTAKHHDGFSLFDTVGRHSDTDYVQMFKDSALAHGLDWGVYYSWYEFENSFTRYFMEDVVEPQLEKLMSYEPHYWWFDGDWCLKTKTANQFVTRYVKKIKAAGGIVNDRIGEDKSLADYYNYSDRFIPDHKMKKWQHITSIGLSWGYNQMQNDSDYMSTSDFLETVKLVAKRGGTLLVNIGPDAKGNMDPREVSVLLGTK